MVKPTPLVHAGTPQPVFPMFAMATRDSWYCPELVLPESVWAETVQDSGVSLLWWLLPSSEHPWPGCPRPALAATVAVCYKRRIESEELTRRQWRQVEVGEATCGQMSEQRTLSPSLLSWATPVELVVNWLKFVEGHSDFPGGSGRGSRSGCASKEG